MVYTNLTDALHLIYWLLRQLVSEITFTVLPYLFGYDTIFPPSRMTTNNLINQYCEILM